ncbi:DapH/DapD/GlmU-related protein [Christiangramia gaetbulicola]|uniref:DapH/DapD/GlmU-related protein n=1 Tax=Christiangramia gaetbulicola TaxID=703340 RepID=UPI000D379900|nr:DapH/DapD/GlmU-related protein [Christiangramia gaetbulicola]
MELSFEEIIDYLKINKIKYSFSGTKHTSYKICSLFEPESNGFYFFVGDNWTYNLERSLIITSVNLDIRSENGFLHVEENPQLIYYQLLNSMFQEKSNGHISKSAIIHKKANLGKNVQIDPFVVIGKSRIGDNTIIKSHCIINDNSSIGKNVIIEPNCTIGATGTAWVWKNNNEKIRQPQLGGVFIEDNCFIGANSVIVRGSLNEDTRVGINTVIAPGARIGHGTKIGQNVHFANNVVTGGNTKIADFCFIGSSVTFRPKVKIHQFTVVAAGAVIVKNTKRSKQLLIGLPAEEREFNGNLKGIPKFSE